MKDFAAKIGHFCENHVEKIVLVVVGAVCVWLFFTRVIFSPNGMVLDRTQKAYAPGQIDRFIYDKKATELRAKLQQSKSGAPKPYARRLDGPIDVNDHVIKGVIDRKLAKGFVGLFESPLSFLRATTSAVRPSAVASDRLHADRRYRLPVIPDVTEVGATHLRAAAYVPLQEITTQTTYDKAAVEPNDIDLVTVEGRFDVAELHRRFQASFAGVDVQREDWRDPCLAKPIFAAVQLQRQEQQEDGSWGDWQPLPRSRIEANRELFQVFEKVENLPPGGLDVRKMLFDHERVIMELLQPESYQIASAEEDWFPPSFYGKFKDLQRKMDSEKRREEKEKDRKQAPSTDLRREAMNRGGAGGGGMYGPQPGGARGAPGSGRIRPNQQGGMMGGDPMMGGQQRGGRIRPGQQGGMMGGDPMMGGARAPRGARRGGAATDPMYGGDMYGMGGDMMMGMPRRATTTEVYWDLAQEMIRFREDLSKRDKPLLFWVFDDNLTPGRSYRYRVRVGVFNPVAGTGQLADRDLDKKDQVVLWSPYSEVTKPVAVQKMLYLFARDVQEKTGTATVEVARYSLGYWRSESFQVKPGEAIGKEMEPKKDEEKDKRARDKARLMAGYGPMGGDSGRITDMRDMMGPGGMGGMPGFMPSSPDQQNVPAKVDYRTGKILVDLVPVNDWGNAPNLRPRMYYDMLFTGDGNYIEHMPVNPTNWPKDLAVAHQFVQSEKHKEPQPFRAFNKGGIRGRGGRGGMPGMEGYDDSGMYDDMGGYGDYGDYGGGGMYPY
ncbi:MAG: hypothetical protein MUC88_15335 [Planctomycetes bacterium]|nr:hypothetical protein [Planctomycetota bacterium]